MVSNANRIGIFSLDCSTAMRCSSLILHRIREAEHRAEPVAHLPSVTRKSGSNWICSSFSSSVILASSEFTRASTPALAGFRVGWSACSSLAVVAATIPPAAAAPSARVNTAAATLSLNLDMIVPL